MKPIKIKVDLYLIKKNLYRYMKNTLNKSKYLYTYDMDQFIECPYCEGRFKYAYSLLEGAEDREDEVSAFCPICREKLDYEYEDIKDALKRVKQIDPDHYKRLHEF